MDRAQSGIAVEEICSVTDDPSVRRRLLSADSNHDGRLSRRDVVRVLQSEVAAKLRLRYGLAAAAVLLALCVVMLAANAALTFHVVRMARETRVHSSGKLTDVAGARVVGTAQAAELVDLRYAHHASPEAAVALLSLKQLLVQPEGGAADGAAAYQVLSASLVPGRQLEFVVAAPARGGPAAPAGTQGLAVEGMAGVLGGAAPNGSAAAAADAAQGALWLGAAPAELARIVVSNAGVHELRGGAAAGAPAQRRLLTVGLGRGVVRGVAVDTTAGACEPGATVCDSAANLIGCPLVPTCGANGKLYAGPCEAKAGGTTVACVGCGPACPGATASEPAFDVSDGRPAPTDGRPATAAPDKRRKQKEAPRRAM